MGSLQETRERKCCSYLYMFSFLASVLSPTMTQTTVLSKRGKAIWVSTGNAKGKAGEETCTVLKVRVKFLIVQNRM